MKPSKFFGGFKRVEKAWSQRFTDAWGVLRGKNIALPKSTDLSPLLTPERAMAQIHEWSLTHPKAGYSFQQRPDEPLTMEVHMADTGNHMLLEVEPNGYAIKISNERHEGSGNLTHIYSDDRRASRRLDIVLAELEVFGTRNPLPPPETEF